MSAAVAPVDEVTSDASPVAVPAVVTPAATRRQATDPFAIHFDGYLRVEAASLWPDRFLGIKMPASTKRDSSPGVGRNDGFALGDARLNLRATYHDNLYVRLGFDGAVVSYADAEDTSGELGTGLKDAYLRYTFAKALNVYVGRFKPPFDVEALTPTEAQFFVHRALESRGVARNEGPHGDLFGQADVGGFAPGRQLGVMLGADELAAFGGVKLGYALAVTNGNGSDHALNDNDLPAAYGRLFVRASDQAALTDEEGPATLGTDDLLVGLSGFYNELSYGLEPNRYRDRVFGAGLDVTARFSAFILQGQLLGARTQAVSISSSEPAYAMGGHVQLSVQVPTTGFYPGYRFALLDPRLEQGNDKVAGSDVDRVMLHTVGVRYQASELPVTMHLEYSHSSEQAGRTQPNDRVEAAVQVTFQ